MSHSKNKTEQWMMMRKKQGGGGEEKGGQAARGGCGMLAGACVVCGCLVSLTVGQCMSVYVVIEGLFQGLYGCE